MRVIEKVFVRASEDARTRLSAGVKGGPAGARMVYASTGPLTPAPEDSWNLKTRVTKWQQEASRQGREGRHLVLGTGRPLGKPQAILYQLAPLQPLSGATCL